MKCDEAEILLHGLVDDEIDAEYASRVATHVQDCMGCAAQLRLHRLIRQMMSNANLRFRASPRLRAPPVPSGEQVALLQRPTLCVWSSR